LRVLLDENIPIDLEPLLTGLDVFSVDQMGWKGVRNGDLLRKAEGSRFDAMVTSDKSMFYQQNNRLRKIALVVINTNYRPSVLRGAVAIAEAINRSQPGSYEEVFVGPSRAPRKSRME